jgi:hypothetical protein
MGFPLSFFLLLNQITFLLLQILLQEKYWCIEDKYRIYVARLRNGGKMIRFVPIILHLSCNTICNNKTCYLI